MLREKEKTKQIYIYEIEPVTFLNFSIDVQSNILNLYSEFLREFNFEFQIFISNKKINTKKYIENIEKNMRSGNNLFTELKKKYVSNIYNQLEKECIYNTKYYIVVSLDSDSNIDINSLDALIQKLNLIGCNTKRIESKNELKYLLYECINKEVVV